MASLADSKLNAGDDGDYPSHRNSGRLRFGGVKQVCGHHLITS